MVQITKPFPLYIGCAGWNIPEPHRLRFHDEGTHLERYSARFNAVEINSSFYRSHKPGTYARWASSVPDWFRFAVKLPKTITHEARLRDSAVTLEQFIGEVTALGDKLGPLLIQLPPGLEFDAVIAGQFFRLLRSLFGGAAICEPRHPSWFTKDVEALMRCHNIARVAADPAVVIAASIPGGYEDVVYYRLHGSPRMYYSSYSQEFLMRLADSIRESAVQEIATWCIFDNTARYAATLNALETIEHIMTSTCDHPSPRAKIYRTVPTI